MSARARPTATAVTAAAIAALLAACATLGGANYVSLDDEWELGRQLEADLNQRLNIVRDATLQRYVNDVGQRLVRQTNLADRPWRFYVVRDPEINAFNVPGGLVYVHTGLLASSGSAAEFVGAFAHEIGHGVARHGTRRLSKQQDVNILAAVVLGQGAGSVAQMGAQIAAAGAFASFSRTDEREADQLAVQLMSQVGYDPEGLARLLERLMEQGAGGGGIFASHPNPAERVKNVRAFAQDVNRARLRMDESGFSAIRSRAAQMR